jgi:DNA-binding response OmpR family regulator
MPKKILIIEDEQYLADMYKMKFEHEGYEVELAYDGERGIERARKSRPDLVLLDLVLPKIDGYAVLRALRANKKTKNLKIYILSNLGQEEEIEEGFKNGANGYLIKANVTPAQLVKSVEKIFHGQDVGIQKRE